MDAEELERLNGALKRKYLALKKAMGRKLKELEDTKREFFNYFEKQQDGALIVDMMGRITFVNQSATEICGYEKDEVLNRHFRMFLALDDLADGFKLFYNILKGEYSTCNFFRVRCKDGSTKIVEVNAAPLHEFGKIVGGLAVIRDMTKRRQMEMEGAERVERFKQFDRDLEDWKRQISELKHEVNELLVELSRGRKYPEE